MNYLSFYVSFNTELKPSTAVNESEREWKMGKIFEPGWRTKKKITKNKIKVLIVTCAYDYRCDHVRWSCVFFWWFPGSYLGLNGIKWDPSIVREMELFSFGKHWIDSHQFHGVSSRTILAECRDGYFFCKFEEWDSQVDLSATCRYMGTHLVGDCLCGLGYPTRNYFELSYTYMVMRCFYKEKNTFSPLDCVGSAWYPLIWLSDMMSIMGFIFFWESLYFKLLKRFFLNY